MSNNKYNLFCIVCKGKITSVRRDAHTCSDMCRLALSNLYKKIEQDTSGLSKEELNQYKKLQARIKGEGKVFKTITGNKDDPEEDDGDETDKKIDDNEEEKDEDNGE